MTRLLVLDITRPILRGQQVTNVAVETTYTGVACIHCHYCCDESGNSCCEIVVPQSYVVCCLIIISVVFANDGLTCSNAAQQSRQQPVVCMQVTLHAHASQETGHMSQLISLLDSKTLEVSKNKPRCLLKGQSAMVEINLSRTICLESYKEYRTLGRIALRDSGRTIAVGTVIELLY